RGVRTAGRCCREGWGGERSSRAIISRVGGGSELGGARVEEGEKARSGEGRARLVHHMGPPVAPRLKRLRECNRQGGDHKRVARGAGGSEIVDHRSWKVAQLPALGCALAHERVRRCQVRGGGAREVAALPQPTTNAGPPRHRRSL